MMAHGHSYEGTQFLACTNPDCRFYQKPFKPPTIALEPADTQTVRKVLEEERVEEEARHRAEAIVETSWWGMTHGSKIGDTVRVRTPLRFR
jgi:hypothetical protein